MGKLIIRLGGGLPRIELVVMGGGGGGWFIMVAPYRSRQIVTSHKYCTGFQKYMYATVGDEIKSSFHNDRTRIHM